MKYFKILICIIVLSLCANFKAQVTYNGMWKGAIYVNNLEDSNVLIAYFSVSKYKSILEALVRLEEPSSLSFSFYKLQGEMIDSKLVFNKIQSSVNKGIKQTFEKNNFELNYIDSTGYLEGKIVRQQDKLVIGKIVLFKSEGQIDSQQKKEVSHAWYYLFRKEYLLGMVSPDKRDAERKNFKFESVYFDPTKSDLKSEYFSYLKKVIKVVNGHTDLRLKVIGHTDWNGSDTYNEELSKKRAETIIQFLEKNGLSRDRIEYEYQGEKKPIDTNETPEGRRHNRRVDFQFI